MRAVAGRPFAGSAFVIEVAVVSTLCCMGWPRKAVTVCVNVQFVWRGA